MQIKELRKEANLTQVQVAETLGVSQSTVCSWELGDAMPRAELLPKLLPNFASKAGLTRRGSYPFFSW